MEKSIRQKRRQNVKKYSLIQLAEELGYTPIRVGNNYMTLKEHDSVRINTHKNTFVQYSTGVSGDPVSFLMQFGLTRSTRFKSVDYCLFWLEKKLNIDNSVTVEKQYEKKQVPLNLPSKDDNSRRVFAYLTKTRKIDIEIYRAFEKRNMIYQDKEHKNCVFVGYNNSKPVYAMQRSSLPSSSFKIECVGCNYDYGIIYENKGSNTLIITEAVIDMMSLMTLNLKTRIHEKHSFLSINSVYKDRCIYNYLNKHPEIEDVLIALDNDEKGLEAYKKISTKIKENYKKVKIMQLTPKTKDWNEDLVMRSKEKEELENIVCF